VDSDRKALSELARFEEGPEGYGIRKSVGHILEICFQLLAVNGAPLSGL